MRAGMKLKIGNTGSTHSNRESVPQWVLAAANSEDLELMAAFLGKDIAQDAVAIDGDRVDDVLARSVWWWEGGSHGDQGR